jgi:type VI protein secretion system component VasF
VVVAEGEEAAPAEPVAASAEAGEPRPSSKVQTWLWVLLGICLALLIALFFFWNMLLRSGTVVFR